MMSIDEVRRIADQPVHYEAVRIQSVKNRKNCHAVVSSVDNNLEDSAELLQKLIHSWSLLEPPTGLISPVGSLYKELNISNRINLYQSG